MSRVSESLEPFEERLAKTFPGLVPGSMFRLARISRQSTHSNIRGELERWRKLQRYLDEEAEELDLLKLPARKRRRLMQRALHDFYLDMYGGDEGDFKLNYRTWRDAVRDVEEMHDMLLGYLPRTLLVNGEVVDVPMRLRRPEEVRGEYDPIKLIALARSGGFEASAWMRHCARVKLYLAQLFYEYRKEGFAPEDIAKETAAVRRKIMDRLFVRGSHRRVRVIAELDPARAYACSSYRISEDMHERIEASEECYVMEAERFVIRGGKRETDVLFFIRPKEFVPLKSLIKNVRLPELASIGDRVAAKFVFKDERDLADAVERIRDVAASRPGCVSDHNSTLQSNGNPSDAENVNSSAGFRVLKYNLRYIGIVNELQFLTVPGEVDSRCIDDEEHRYDYKLRQFSQSIMSIVYATRYTGIPFPTFARKNGKVVPVTHADIYQQLLRHGRRAHHKVR